MNNNDYLISEINSQMESYLIHHKGIENPNKPFLCFYHSEKTPSMSFDRSTNKVKCFGCGAGGDVLDLIKRDYNTSSFPETIERACSILGIAYNPDISDTLKKRTPPTNTTPAPVPEVAPETTPATKDYTDYYKKCFLEYDKTDYLTKRGISSEVAKRFRIGFDTNFKATNRDTEEFETWRAITIPVSKGSYVVRNTDLNASKKNRVRNKGESTLYNSSILSAPTEAPIFIVEGEIDTLSIIEAGGLAIGLGGTSNVNLFIKAIEATPVKHTYIIALDNDTAGELAKNTLSEALKARGEKFVAINPYKSYKDANEALTSEREAFIKRVTYLSKDLDGYIKKVKQKEYANSNAYSGLKRFIDTLQTSVNTPYIPTGFNQLDLILEGGLYEGLYIFGAVPSLGKTAFILQMIDQIAERASSENATEEEKNTDILFFALEMSQDELIARSLSRITFLESMRRNLGLSNAKTNRGITTYKRYNSYNNTEIQLIQDAIKIYSKRAQHIYFVEGVGNISAQEIRAKVEEHIQITGHRPVVVVDYLQILAPWIDKEHPNRVLTDKQSTDKSVLELKRISRDFKIPVISVSSFNREGYKSIGDLMSAFKESGAIEYGADFLGGMVYGDMILGSGKVNNNFDLNEAKSNDPRKIDMFVIKNRNGAIPKRAIRFNYKPMFHCYEEEI